MMRCFNGSNASNITRFLTVLLLASAGCYLPLQAQQLDPSQLKGLWGSERTFVQLASGELSIRREHGIWSASIGSYSVPVHVEGDKLDFALPVRGEGFRGKLSTDRQRIRGYWIGQPNVVNMSRFVWPLELQRKAVDVWRGLVVPLEDRLTIYLVVREKQDGSYEAFFRNPERNLESGHIFHVALTGTTLDLKDTQTGSNSRFGGSYDPETSRLTLFWPSYGLHLDFTRRGREDAHSFYPREPSEKIYQYSPPPTEDDGWATSSLTDVGFDQGLVKKLVQKVIDTDPFNPNPPLIHSLLIARHGRLVLEEYFYGNGKAIPHDLRSAPKSFSSLLIGIALDRGAPFNVKTPLYSLFPEYKVIANPDPRKQLITVENLLTMTSGFACDDSDPSSPGRESLMYEEKSQPDWYRYTLDQPVAYAPGQKWLYCTAGVNLLGGILRNTTKEWTTEFFGRYLAEPLQMRNYYLNLTPENEVFMGGGDYLCPRDTLKIGQLFLNGGVWNGRRVISKQWIDASTSLHSQPSTTAGYGYNWWLHEIRAGDHVYQEYEAAGNGGQLLMVIPALDLTVLVNAGTYGRSALSNLGRDEFLPQFIIPAIVRQ